MTTALGVGAGPARARLADGRWHFAHGPIDLVMSADGDPQAVAEALDAAWLRFSVVLQTLVGELPLLRMDARDLDLRLRTGGVDASCGPLNTITAAPETAVDPLRGPHGIVAARMVAAVCAPARAFDLFVTPMAAVAGAVAEHVAEAFERPGIARAAINNGGDIALVLAPQTHWDIGVIADPADPKVGARLRIAAADRIRGIATSGWHGRSLSLGIADSVTVLADDAPAADCAATLIANHVDLPGHPGIVRRPACQVRDGSDLGERLVTVGVPELSRHEVDAALERGAAFARRCIDSGFARQALLTLQGHTRVLAGSAPAQVRMARSRIEETT